jgi:hypothetical protein
MPPPSSVREELKPEGEGWVVEVRGFTYWHPEATSDVDRFIQDTLLQNIITRSRSLPEPKTDAEKEAAARDPYAGVRGKISHAFLYNVWEDKNPAAGSFIYIRSNLLDPLITADPNSAAGGVSGPMGMGSFGPPGVSSGGTDTVTWAPLVSGGSSATAGAYGPAGPGGPGMPGPAGPGGPGLPIGGMIPGGLGMPPPMGPEVGGTTPPKGLKIKPRFEFIVVFVWKEPTPSDKLRKINKIQAQSTDTGGGKFGMGPSGPSSPAPSTGSSDGGLGAGAGRRGELDP